MTSTSIRKGLTAAQVAESRRLHGANLLTPPRRTLWWRLFLDKFRDPLIIILMVAGLLSVAIACYEYWGLGLSAEVFFEPAGIFVAILLATGLAFYFEMKAEGEFSLLNRVNDDEPVQVVRDGNTTTVPRRDVVVGDIVILNTGDEIPADGRLLEAVSMNVDESTLTGEPVTSKSADPAQADAEATYPSDAVMRGTSVVEGHGIMEVTAVGDATEAGRIFASLSATGRGSDAVRDAVRTPLDIQLARLSRVITIISYIVAVTIIAGRVLMFTLTCDFQWIPFLAYLLQSVMIAVTLIVVSVPEGLPMAVTLALAYSMRRMLRTNNLVRKMHACETMGATTVICTDKSDAVVADALALNSTADLDFSAAEPKVLGNPTEGALLLWLHSRGIDYRTLRRSVTVTAELPFSTERKYMATAVRDAAGNEFLYIKSAPEIVFDMCQDTAGVSRAEIDALLLGYQNRAMRTLGFAWARLEPDTTPLTGGRPSAPGITFLGVTAISDPVRPDVPAAVREVLDAGIGVKIVTGDTPATAREIGRRIGLWDDAADTADAIITGPQFASLSDDELRRRVRGIKIIARARPMDKKRLVESLQDLGEVVAVTGDGTNDAPALKAAQVGLSMGSGTSVAKEASDITIIDDSFSSIGRAVMWGRSLYRNIQRFLLFQLTVNVTASLLVLCGAFMGTESPLTVTQMLWINLIMDTFAAMALASLPPERSVMKDRPRNRRDFILTPMMDHNIIGVGGFFFLLLMFFLLVFKHCHIDALADLLHVDYGSLFAPVLTAAFWTGGHVDAYELTLLFTIFVMTHFFYLFNARAFETGRSALHLRGCGGLLLIAALILIGQVAMVEVPGVQRFFNVTGLSAADWGVIIIGSSFVLWVREAHNTCRRLIARHSR